MKKHLFGAAIAAALSVLALAPAAAQEVTLRIHTFMVPVANPVKHFLEPWAKKVEADSKGKIKVQVFTAMQLGGHAPQLLEQVRDGVVDIVWTLPGFTPGVMPEIEAFELPFVHRDTYSTVMAIQDFIKNKYMADKLAPYHVLLVHAHAGNLIMSKDPIEKAADFKGMKLRAASRTNAWTLESLGSAAVQVALPELVPMMSKGTITGSILPYEISPSVKMQDLANYFVTMAPPQPRMSTAVFMFLMNKKKYESLSPELKKVIDDNSGLNLAPVAIKTWNEIEENGEKVMRSKPKNHFVSLSPEETAKVRKEVQPVFDRFEAELDKRGEDGKKIVADAEALIAKYAKQEKK